MKLFKPNWLWPLYKTITDYSPANLKIEPATFDSSEKAEGYCAALHLYCKSQMRCDFIALTLDDLVALQQQCTSAISEINSKNLLHSD